MIDRRVFIKNLGLALGAAYIPHTSFALPSAKLKVALVGLGRYAKIVADNMKDSGLCEITGLVSGSPEKLSSWQKTYGVPSENCYNYENFDNIKSNSQIDLVYVILPNSMHKEYTLRAANAGKHFIVEKPMALNAHDCLEMINACNKARVQLAMGYRLHFEPYNLEMKRLGQDKVFGPVRHMETSLGYDSADANNWRHKIALSGGGPLMNLGVYCIQAARYISGEEPLAVSAQFGPKTAKPELFKEIEASITWQMEFPSGALCNSTSTYMSSIDRLYASADNGFFEMSPAISYGPFKGRTHIEELHFPEINQQAAQMDGIAAYILAKKPVPSHISGQEGYMDMKVIDAVYKSAKSGGKRVRV
jgi:predicted dehydrogenase